MYPTLFLGLAVGLLVSATSLVRAHAPAVDMLDATQKFLGALNAEQSKQATYPLTDKERENWNFVDRTPGPAAKTDDPRATRSRHRAHSQRARTPGMVRAEAGAMSMELVLKELENDTPAGRRSPISTASPSSAPRPPINPGAGVSRDTISFNFTLVNGSHVFFTPSFIGNNPAPKSAPVRAKANVRSARKTTSAARSRSPSTKPSAKSP